jgi:hypothetical protein
MLVNSKAIFVFIIAVIIGCRDIENQSVALSLTKHKKDSYLMSYATGSVLFGFYS